MAEKNDILELAKIIGNREGLEKDFLNSIENFRESLQKNYINKIHNATERKKKAINSIPPKEVNLIRALKPFNNEQSKKQMDKAIDLLMMINTIKNIQNDVSEITSNTKTIINMSNDGLEEKREYENLVSSAKISGILMALALAKII